MDVGGKRDGNCSAFWDQNCYFMWLWRNKHEHKDDFIRPLKPWEVILKACDEYSNGVVVHVMASGNTSSEVMIGLMMAVGFVVLLRKLAVPQPMLLSCGKFQNGSD
ncbi:hypothetical protein D0Y65_006122 [Glycine soja]|uniref:Uncharacterized protein n=1 Tax=Glycine soja TaxID=3848 RepID=A0A445L7H5_GLYSO|nr:hypothetical protein D0Y65_006122 [Glycine soja]RZC19173.1 hypothetical protein D0Y65_006122 [Glycine soja]